MQLEILLDIAKEILCIAVEQDDNLLELGLNSIIATQIAWLSTQRGVPITAMQILESSTIRVLLSKVETMPDEASRDNRIGEEIVEELFDSNMPLTDSERSLYHHSFMGIHQ